MIKDKINNNCFRDKSKKNKFREIIEESIEELEWPHYDGIMKDVQNSHI